ncbi:MAG: holin family protein [Brevirhabdus sp.]
MGLIGQLFGFLFGSNRNVIVETAEVFRENSEAAGQRQSRLSADALAQFAAEFAPRRRGMFDRFMDGLNRVPRPAMALGTLGLIVAALVDPVWFSSRMQGLALVPDPLWWLLGAIVSFYFGARSQVKGQEFQASLAETLSRAPVVAENLEQLQSLGVDSPSGIHGANPALDEWRKSAGSSAKKK